MSVPQYPSNLLPRPFADNGTYQIIPDDKNISGRASWKEGFPTETQLPLSNGGVAPSRMDFNGVLYMLSSLAVWQQGGGLFLYDAGRDYNTPAMVMYADMLWFCKAANGPGATVGVKEPGTDANFWISFLDFLARSGGGGGMNPVGTVIQYYGTTAPDGYLSCDGSPFSITTYPQLYALLGKSTTPDMRGVFVRGYDPTAARDPDGATRNVGSEQQDTLQNLTGEFWGANGPDGFYVASSAGSVFTTGQALGTGGHFSGINGTGWAVRFDASRNARTSTETRGKNVNLLYCIKHD